MATVEVIEDFNKYSTLQNSDEIFKHQKHIPVVHYTLFKDDYLSDESKRSKYVDMEKIVNLLMHPHASNLYERHSLALRKLLKHSSKGFMMRDSLYISKLLTICTDRSVILPQIYYQPLVGILDICSRPLLKEKASDKMVYRKVFVDLLSQIGYSIRLENTDVRLQICKTLHDLFTQKPDDSKTNDLIPNDLDFTKQSMEESDVVEILIKSLGVIGQNLELKLSILNLLQLLTKASGICCNKLLNTDAIELLFDSTSYDCSCNVLFRCVEIIWNIFEKGDKATLNVQFSNQKYISWLRDSFIEQLSKGYSTYNRQLRNDLLTLSTVLAQLNPLSPFVECGFVKQLTLLATFQEVKSHNPLVKNLKLSLNHEDFEFKKLLINLLVILSENKCVIPFLEEGQFLLALFNNIYPATVSSKKLSTASDSKMSKVTNPPGNVWKPAYQEELQLHALASLSSLVPRMMCKFQDTCGVNRLLMFVEWCINDNMTFIGDGNGFHAEGGRGNKLSQMRYCMRLILKIVKAFDETVNQEFVDEGCITLFIDILSNVVKSEDTNSSVDLEIQSDMLFTLAALCERDPHRKELFGYEGVMVLIAFLKQCLNIATKNFTTQRNVTDGSINAAESNNWQKITIAVVDAVWSCIVGCYATEHMFLDQNGVFIILDLLEIIPSELYCQILGCLVDLSENVKALNHLRIWRGKILKENKSHLISSKESEVQMNIAHLMCRIWREEELKIAAIRGECGTLIDINYPLMGSDQRASEIVPNLGSDQSSISILEVSESLRANIYALFSRLGYLDHPGLQIEDHITLTIIESYLEFKMGEVWNEIQKELDLELIRPVSPDVEALEWISRCTEQEGVRVSKVQTELLEAKIVQDGIEEFEYYNQLRENHRQKEKNIQHFQEFVERTSNYDKLKQAKHNQIVNIEASRIGTKHIDNEVVFHKTDIDNINVTKFCAEYVHIDSTPIHILGGTLAAMETFGRIGLSRDSQYLTKQA